MRSSNMNILGRTFGFFCQGIPVVFIKSDILFRAYEAKDDYFNLIGEDGGAKLGVPFDDAAAAAFGRFATLLHELRHFHDALLCRPLFEQFLRQQKISFCMIQILSRLKKLRYIPTGMNDPIWKSDPELSKLKQVLLDADEDAYNRSLGIYATATMDSDTISLEHLLEASTVTAELLHLYTVHGIEPMERYYRTIVVTFDRVYTLLLDRFIALHGGDLPRAISALYFAVGISLCSSDSPVNRFASLYTELCENPETIHAEIQSWLSNPCPGEADLERRVQAEWLLELESRKPVPPERLSGHEFPIDELVQLHHKLYEARRTLIEAYIKAAAYAPRFYVEHLHEFAAPAILFYPVEAHSSATTVPAMLESELPNQGVDNYIIAATDDERGRIVFAGLRNFPFVAPCLSFAVTDQVLLTNFCYQVLFEGRDQLYSRGVDDIYRQVLSNVVLAN